MTLGNDDIPELVAVFEDGDRLIYGEGKVCVIDGLCEVASLGYSTPTPWNTPRELDESELEAQLVSLTANLEQPERALFNVHCPPRDTPIDQAPELDADLRPRASAGGGVVTAPVGSRAVRKVIEEVGPQLGLHGHVHESPGVARIGRALCINPGSDYSSGVLRGALLSFTMGGELQNWQLVQG